MLTLLKRLALSSLAAATILSTSSAQEGQELSLEGESVGDLAGWLEPDFRENDTRYRLDLSVRSVHKAGVERTGLLSAVGLDLHHVYSSSTGPDLGTLRMQGFALRADGLPATPGFFEDNHDWEWTYRIFDFNYTRLSAKGVNFRLGHYEVPYGLEQTQTSNGTLRDYLSKTTVGIKADWGVALNGQLPNYEYEVSLSRGSGQTYRDLEENYLFAGRIGTPREDNLCVGASFMSGQLPLPMGGFIHKERVGIDAIWTLPIVTVLSEINFGKNAETDVASGMLEVNCTSSNEQELAYVQFLGTDTDGDDKYWATLGSLHHLGDGVSLSAQWKVDLDALEDDPRSEAFMFQLRYRF